VIQLSTRNVAAPSPLARLAGLRVLVLNWRDVRHPQAGGAEQYMHQIARRWVDAGAHVTWCTARPPGRLAVEVIDGIRVVRSGGELSLYLRAAARMVRTRTDIDVVVDCQNGIPFFSPLFAGTDVPVVQVIHHVHQDQFGTRFSRPVAALGRFLEGTATRRVYGPRAVVAVSPSTRQELRHRLRFRCPIFVVPNGSVTVPDLTGPRDPEPTVALVSRLVPHKRHDLLLHHVRTAARRVPQLRVDIVGDGPERERLQALVVDLGLQRTVTFHGYQPDAVRDALLSRAWLTTATSAAEGWGCSVIEAAAWGVPCVAMAAPGINDSVVDGCTGWVVEPGGDFGHALADALAGLADESRARVAAADCQAWARCFTWDRSAELLARVVLGEVDDNRTGAARADRRYARGDISTVATFPSADDTDLSTGLRTTDEVAEQGGLTSLLLGGCDEFDAVAVLRRLGVSDADVRLAERTDLLTGPAAARRLPWYRRTGAGRS
jgi:glycosyltransferase involved in cell wall biosynthesis